MKPEDDLDEHVQRRSEVVTPLDVRRFVREHRFELARFEHRRHTFRQQHGGTNDADHRRLVQVRGTADVERIVATEF
jgi:hypothetical protein